MTKNKIIPYNPKLKELTNGIKVVRFLDIDIKLGMNDVRRSLENIISNIETNEGITSPQPPSKGEFLFIT